MIKKIVLTNASNYIVIREKYEQDIIICVKGVQTNFIKADYLGCDIKEINEAIDTVKSSNETNFCKLLSLVKNDLFFWYTENIQNNNNIYELARLLRQILYARRPLSSRRNFYRNFFSRSREKSSFIFK